MSTPIEARLLRLALDGALPRLLDIGLNPAILGPPFDEAFRRLAEHYSKYRKLPATETAKEMFEGLGNVVAPKKECGDSAEYYWNKTLDDGLNNALINSFEEISRQHSEKKVYGRTLLTKILNDVRGVGDKYSARGSACQTSEGAGRELKEEYETAKSGKINGMPIDPRFKGLVDGLICLRPAHITTIIARSKTGKTFLALCLCLHAAVNGHRVLISSMEMIRIDIVRRLVCLHGGLNYDAALKGHLIPAQEKKYQQLLDDADAVRGFWANIRYMNPAEITDIDSVERQALHADAQLVLADAFYDFPSSVEFDEDWKRIRHNLREVREVSLATKRHWILTAQFGKAAKRSADDYAVGGTDAINYVSNTTIYMLQDARDRDLGFVKIRIGKARETQNSKAWKHHWNFIDMNLDPVGIVPASEGSGKRKMKGFGQ